LQATASNCRSIGEREVERERERVEEKIVNSLEEPSPRKR
jgi:hypothetical protein